MATASKSPSPPSPEPSLGQADLPTPVPPAPVVSVPEAPADPDIGWDDPGTPGAAAGAVSSPAAAPLSPFEAPTPVPPAPPPGALSPLVAAPARLFVPAAVETTQAFRPNLKDPRVRRSDPPTSGAPGADVRPSVPLPPARDVAISETDELRPSAPVSSRGGRPSARFSPLLGNDDKTQAYSAPRPGAGPISRPSGSGPRSGRASNPDVGNEDQTRAYSIPSLDSIAQAVNAEQVVSANDDITRAYSSPLDGDAGVPTPRSGIRNDDVTRAYIAPVEEATGRRRTMASGATLTRTQVSMPTAKPPRRGLGYWVLPPLIGALALATVALWPAPAAVRVPAAARADVPAEVDGQISAIPETARISIDGKPMTNPLRGKRPHDLNPHELKVEAPGYLPLVRTIRFDRSVTLTLELGALPPSAPEPTVTAAADEEKKTAPKPRWRGTWRPRPAPAAKPTVDPSCIPPFTIDEKGVKHYKPKCL